MTGFLLYLKSIAVSRTLYVTLVSMILACVLISYIKPSTRDDITAGLVCEDDGFCDKLMEELSDAAYTWMIYDDEETLTDAILKGDADYGFRVRGDVEEAVRNDETDRSVIFYNTPFDVYGEVLKENFAESYISAISRYIIEEEADRVFDTEDGDPTDALLAKNAEYLDSELLFDVNIIETDTDSRDAVYTGAGAESVRFGYIKIVIATAVFVSIMSVYGRTYRGDMKAVLNCMAGRERLIHGILYMTAGALPVAVTGLITGGVLMGPDKILKMIISMVLLMIYGILWTLLCGRILRKGDVYAAVIPVAAGLQLIFCLAYINMKDYVPVLSVVRFLFPAGLML